MRTNTVFPPESSASRVQFVTQLFLSTAGGVFSFTALLKLLAAFTRADSLAQSDVVLPFLTVRFVMLLAVILETGVVLLLLRPTLSQVAKLNIIAWISTLFLTYKCAWTTQVTTSMPCPCLGSLPQQYGIPPRLANNITFVTLVAILAGAVILRFMKTRCAQSYVPEDHHESSGCSNAIQRSPTILAWVMAMVLLIKDSSSDANAASIAQGHFSRQVITGGVPETTHRGTFEAFSGQGGTVLTMTPENDPDIVSWRFSCTTNGSQSIVEYTKRPIRGVAYSFDKGVVTATTNDTAKIPINASQVVATLSCIPDATIDSIWAVWLAFGAERHFSEKEPPKLEALFPIDPHAKPASSIPTATWKIGNTDPFSVSDYTSVFQSLGLTNEIYRVTEWIVRDGVRLPGAFYFKHHFGAVPERIRTLHIHCLTECVTTNWLENVQESPSRFAIPYPARVIDQRFATEGMGVKMVDFMITNDHLPSMTSVKTLKQYQVAISTVEAQGQPAKRTPWITALICIALLPLAWMGYLAIRTGTQTKPRTK